jgi:parallel beta-helix repeat protein
VLSSTALTGFGNAQTNVFDDITTDTVWNAAGSPYVFSSTIVVAENAKLTIEPGVTVDFGEFSLKVKGTLNAKCNSSDPIEFVSENTQLSLSTTSQIFFEPSSTSYNEADGTGCIIENAKINAAITINGSAPKISGCQIKGGITIIQAAPTITGNNISEGGAVYAIAIEQESSPTIVSNSILGKAIGISFNMPNNGYSNNTFNANVENNTIVDCLTGIGIEESSGIIRVYGNLIYGSDTAIKAANTSAAVTVQYNLIMNNTLGIDVGAQLAIQENTVYNNTVGIYYQTTAQSLISQNNIMNNTIHNFETSNVSPTSLEAVYNYWGTRDIPTINQTIYDKNNNETLGEVKYLPALDSPYAGAPIIPNVDMNPSNLPTPTVTPTQTTSTNSLQPTSTKTATITPTQVTQGTQELIEISIIVALSIIIAITLVIAYKKGGKKPNSKKQ